MIVQRWVTRVTREVEETNVYAVINVNCVTQSHLLIGN